jgi:predicted AlkP superfamily pyrophosphatase or phosphodiesterase
MMIAEFTFILISTILQLVKCDLEAPETYQLLVISFDGLRADRLDEFIKENPNSTFGNLISTGVTADYMKPSFPTSTFPNHYT